MKNILFSPVSDTDPIAESIKNKIYTDGSLIHILRYYDIDKVYLYLSKEMLDYEKEDKRYTKSIKRISKHKYNDENKIEYCIEERPQLIDVHIYDDFYEDFQNILSKIREEANGGKIYLNISSGTPAMKSTLFTIHQLGDFEYKSIQVSTPLRHSNKQRKNFDENWWNFCADDNPEKYYKKQDSKWILNTNINLDVIEERTTEENNVAGNEKTEEIKELKNIKQIKEEYIKDNPEGRCSEEKSLNLLNIKYKEIVKELINKYEYYPAKVVIKDKMNIYNNIKEKYIKLLELAHSRLLLNFDEVDKIIDESNINLGLGDKRIYRPFDNTDELSRKYFEYVLSLDIKVKKTQYGDFIRAISPIIVDIFAIIINKWLNIDVYKTLCIFEKGMYKWDEEKLKRNSEINSILQKRYNNKFKYNEVYSSHLIKIIGDKKIIKKINNTKYNDIVNICKNLRNIEGKVRNQASHQIVSITDEFIKTKAGYNSEEIVDKIKQALEYSGINIEESHWNSYEEMNKLIIKTLEI